MLLRVLRHVRDRWVCARDPIRYARGIGVSVGEGCRLYAVSAATFGSEPYLISLGDRVCVAAGARFITHDGATWVFRPKYPSIDVMGRIVVGDNVFIGLNVVILPGVEIGSNSVVAAGAVLTRSVPSGVVVGGVPARVLCTVDEYEAAVLPRASHNAHLPPAQRARLHVEQVATMRATVGR